MPRTKRNGSLFIQSAIKKPGSFHAYCKREGFGKANLVCIRKGLQSRDRITRQRANLALNLSHMRSRK